MSDELNKYDLVAISIVRFLSRPSDEVVREFRKRVFFMSQTMRAYEELPARLGQDGYERAYDISHDVGEGLQVLEGSPELAASYFSRALELWDKK